MEVACAGGRGRTGTALADLAILDGSPAAEAVAYVRQRYDPQAVETPWPRRYVARLARPLPAPPGEPVTAAGTPGRPRVSVRVGNVGRVAVLTTSVLAIEYTDEGDGAPVVLVHGWPDAACGWDAVRTGLLDARYRVIVPSLRGSGGTAFLADTTVRDGTGVALAQDVLDLLDGLGLDRVAVVGHDWGARAAFTLAAVAPHRLTAVAALALAYQPRGAFVMPASFTQARLFWYQWLMYVDAGAAAITADPIGFAREQWDTWSPAGWYDEADFDAATESFRNPDWPAITLNGYRTRFLDTEPVDPRYDELRQRVKATSHLSVPTLMLHGAADACDPPATSLGLDGHFDDYRRVVIADTGHFPHREAPATVVDEVVAHLSAHR